MIFLSCWLKITVQQIERAEKDEERDCFVAGTIAECRDSEYWMVRGSSLGRALFVDEYWNRSEIQLQSPQYLSQSSSEFSKAWLVLFYQDLTYT